MRSLYLCFALLVMLSSVAYGAKLHTSHAPQPSPNGGVRSIPTPKTNPHYALGVSGHSAGVAHSSGGEKPIIWMAGGCNFPKVPAADGGRKHFYRDIYIGQLSCSDSIRWRLAGQLPHNLAYAATLLRPSGALIAGGQDEEGLRPEVYQLEIVGADSITLRLHSQLPEGVSGASLVELGGTLYLIGGSNAGGLSNTVYKCTPRAGEAPRWEVAGTYVPPCLLKTLAWATDRYIYLIGSIAHSEQEDVPAEPMLSLLRYDAQTNDWQDVGFPDALRAEGITLGGGALCRVDDRRVLLSGGVHLDRFLPAIHRGQWMRLAQKAKNAEEVERLRQENYVYLTQSEEWYKFASSVWLWEEDEAVEAGRWTRLPHTIAARADAALVEYSPRLHLLIGGERKPGMRSSELYLLSDLLSNH